MSFSPGGSRIVTGSEDQTAKMWDTSTGTLRLNLKGHTERVLSVSFSPDETRIVTGSWDQTAKVWDARTGTPLLDLKGHLGPVWSASVQPERHTGRHRQFGQGGQGVGRSDRRALERAKRSHTRGDQRVVQPGRHADRHRHQRRSGEGLGCKIGPAIARRADPRGRPGPASLSPDGRLIAHPGRQPHHELISLQPDSVELADRLMQAQPKSWRYREGYEAAKAANDQFAAKFYHDRLSPSDLLRLRAETIVLPLFARLLLRDDVLAALQAQPAAVPELQAACLKLAGSWPESATECNNVGFSLVREPGQPAAIYQRGLRLATAACRLEPFDGFFLNTLGVAQYRSGRIAEALATLTRSNEMNKQSEPADLAFLALAQHRLGQSRQAHNTLGRACARLMKRPQSAGDQEAEAFLREAETIELDQVFPANPFAH